MRRPRLRPPSTATFEVLIESLSSEGRGIGRVGGKVVFVEGGLPGESVRARYLLEHRRYDEAVATEVVMPAPERVPPICRHYGTCGGCSLQHLDHAAQLRHKESILLEQLGNHGGISPRRILPPIRSPGAGYRHRGRLSARWFSAGKRTLVGFRERRSNETAEIESCEILHPRIGTLLPRLSALVSALSVADAVPQIELAISEADCGLVLRHLRPLNAADRELLLGFEGEHGVRWFTQPGDENTVEPLDPTRPPLLQYCLEEFDVLIRFGPTDFTQVNFSINRQLVLRAVELLDCTADENVLDLFCGLGNFSLPVARRARSVTGVEGLPGLVAGARENAERNDIGNVEFVTADLSQAGPDEPLLRRDWGGILLDPPRGGAQEALSALNHRSVRTLVYVSCNPATLARDTALLVKRKGYTLEAVGIVDMFPHTAHVECIARFIKE
jgi:23S rRNA (uracil1939-C5)-methyltransferase